MSNDTTARDKAAECYATDDGRISLHELVAYKAGWDAALAQLADLEAFTSTETIKAYKLQVDRLAAELAECREAHNRDLGDAHAREDKAKQALAAEKERDLLAEANANCISISLHNSRMQAERERADKLDALYGDLQTKYYGTAEERDQARAECERLKSALLGDCEAEHVKVETERDNYRAEIEELKSKLILTKVGSGHYRSERDIHIKESETFVREATAKIKAQAEEIERLERARKTLCNTMTVVCLERDRYRAALERIAELVRYCLGPTRDVKTPKLQEAEQIAREALKGES